MQRATSFHSKVGAGLASLFLVLTVLSDAGQAYPRLGRTERVSLTARGGPPLYPPIDGITDSAVGSFRASISANGRLVAFESDGLDIVSDDRNASSDIFLLDRATGKITRPVVSLTGVDPVGVCASDDGDSQDVRGSFEPSISSNGARIVFQSCASNLVPGDTNNASDVFVLTVRTGRIERVSVDSKGEQSQTSEPGIVPASNVGQHAISDDGDVVVFESSADNLVQGDTNKLADMFVHDLGSDKTERISVATDGSQQNNNLGTHGRASAANVSISGNGDYAAFASASTTLSPEGRGGIFLRDLREGTTRWISWGADLSLQPIALDRSGRHIAFSTGHCIKVQGVPTSPDCRMVPNDRTSIDTFVFDRLTARLERVSVAWTGEEGRVPLGSAQSGGMRIAITADGRHVAFASDANNLVPGGVSASSEDCVGLCTTGPPQAYIHDRLTGATELLSRGYNGEAGDQQSFPLSLSSTGRYSVMTSLATDLAKPQADDIHAGGGGVSDVFWDLFLRDRGEDLGSTLDGAPKLHVGGAREFSERGVLFAPDAKNDLRLPVPSANLLGAKLVYRPSYGDLFLSLDVQRLGPLLDVTHAHRESSVLMHGLRFRTDRTGYEVRVEPGDGGALDSPDFGLFECGSGRCERISDLHGGFGTTGDAITVSIPLSKIGAQGGGVLTEITAFSGIGHGYLGGAVEALDEIAMS